MANGQERFVYHFNMLDTLLAAASVESNPALYLLNNNARTPLFMLEGLARFYEFATNQKRFKKMKEHFKLLEDGLGQIDYYQGFQKDFETLPGITDEMRNYLQRRINESANTLNNVLMANDWLGNQLVRSNKTRQKLDGAEWPAPAREIKLLRSFYEVEIAEINKLLKAIGPGFTEIETQVHSMRRKLRWLSIYPQALRGLVQLTQHPSSDPLVIEYLTPEIIQSPFNKMPDAGDNKNFLMLERDHFLALSWMIAELGKLKDSGLKVFAVSEALEQLEDLNHTLALQKAGQITSGDDAVLLSLLNQATSICKRYFAGKHLDKLIYGTGKIVA